MSKVNKRTVIFINESEGEVNIYTHNVGLKMRLVAFSEQNPDLCRLGRKYPNDVESYLLDKRHAYSLLRHTDLIRPRIQKSLEALAQQTRKKAEVFTPAWLCNLMNNHCDEDWFGCTGVFNTENEDPMKSNDSASVL